MNWNLSYDSIICRFSIIQSWIEVNPFSKPPNCLFLFPYAFETQNTSYCSRSQTCNHNWIPHTKLWNCYSMFSFLQSHYVRKVFEPSSKRINFKPPFSALWFLYLPLSQNRPKYSSKNQRDFCWKRFDCQAICGLQSTPSLLRVRVVNKKYLCCFAISPPALSV